MNQSELCHIIGAGAIGQYFAYELSKHTSICLHSRSSVISQIEFEDLNQQTHKVTLNKDDNHPISTLIICTKSFSSIQAFDQYQQRLTPQSTVICLFNGLGPQFEIENLHNKTFFATTTVGAKLIDKQKVRHTGLGETFFGANKFKQPLNELPQFPNWQHCSQITTKLFQKLAINALINPLTVIHNCKNGALLNNQKALNTMRSLSEELSKLSKLAGAPQSAQDIYDISCDVASKTSENYSSMHQDITFNRQTEIELINGFWQKLSDKHKQNSPTNLLLLNKIRELSTQSNN